MIRAILKFVLLASVVLLLGQAHIGKLTLAEHYHRGVNTSWKWLNGEVKRSGVWAFLGDHCVHRWLERLMNFFPKSSGREQEGNGEKIRSDDRASLMRLLD